MKLWFTPTVYQLIAFSFKEYRWQLLQTSILGFILYFILKTQINVITPNSLVWLNLFILFMALQALVLSAFIFFFKQLPSSQNNEANLQKFYHAIEWCEAILFTFLLPLPTLLFIVALFRINM